MRAPAAGIRLTNADAAIAKGMIARGDRQHDIAAYFGVNGGRIAEISTGDTFASVQATPAAELPPPGPYIYRNFSRTMKSDLVKMKGQLVEFSKIIDGVLGKI